MAQDAIRQLQSFVDTLAAGGWVAQSMWLVREVALAAAALDLDHDTLDLHVDFRREEGWLDPLEVDLRPEERLATIPLPAEVVPALNHLSNRLRRRNDRGSGHRLRVLAACLDAWKGRGIAPETPELPSHEVRSRLRALPALGYPFEAALLIVMTVWQPQLSNHLQVWKRHRDKMFDLWLAADLNPGKASGSSVLGEMLDGLPISLPDLFRGGGEGKGGLGIDLVLEPKGSEGVELGNTEVFQVPPAIKRVQEKGQTAGSAPSCDGGSPLSPPSPDRSYGATMEAESTEEAAKEFLFELRGEHVAGCRVRPGSELELRFDYLVPSAANNPRVAVVGERLDLLKAQALSFRMTLNAPGFLFLNDFSCRVEFENGELKEPVAFRLKAPEAPERPEVTVWVQMSRRGRTFYELPIQLRIEDPAAAGSDAPESALPKIDLDSLATIHSGSFAARKVSLALMVWQQQLHVSLVHSERGHLLHEPITAFGLSELTHLLERLEQQIRPGLTPKVWAREDLLEPWEDESTESGSTDFLDDPEARKSLEQFAAAGWDLWKLLAEDPSMKKCLAVIDGLADGSEVEVRTNRVFLPWEMINPHKFEADWPAAMRPAIQPQRFWGYRFRIETGLMTEDPMVLDLEPPSGGEGPTRIALMVNPAIDEERGFERARPSASHADILSRLPEHVTAELLTDGDDMKMRLLTAEDPWTMIYIFSHGQREGAFQGKKVEKLVLDRGVELTPDGLDYETRLSHAPIVVLSSCGSGAYSPLKFDSFYSVFKKRGACGLVAAHYSLPTLFAAQWGRRLVTEYAEGELTIGEIVHGLRVDLLRRGIPLGLLYAVQCPLEAKAPSAPEPTLRRSA